jgi:uncharacterized RDD family membrane protein YckC
MTQPGDSPAQETQQPAAAERPASSVAPEPGPSPYLPGGQAAPQAYPAPPQPGSPRYGAPQQQPYGRPFPARPGADATGRPPARRAGTADPALAERWRRLTGWLIDWLIIAIIPIVLFGPALHRVVVQMQDIAARYPNLSSPAATAAISNAQQALTRPASDFSLTFAGIALVYCWIQYAAWGATIGKRAVGTRVVTAAGHSRITVTAAGIRSAVYAIGIVIPFLWLVDNFWLLVDARRQCLHDKAASTVVIKASAQPAQAHPPSW